MYLILDTETTGLEPTSRLVSICWAFYDTGPDPVFIHHYLIKPVGFVIPPEATAIHGITTWRARRHGIPLPSALAILATDIRFHAPSLCVGHNIEFDRTIIVNEFRRLGAAENVSILPAFCTMETTTNLCRLPRRDGRPGYKWPRLAELHHHLFGRPHTQAHDAEGDVRACAACFFELRRRGYPLTLLAPRSPLHAAQTPNQELRTTNQAPVIELYSPYETQPLRQAKRPWSPRD